MAAGAPSVGIKAKNGVVIAVEKKQKSVLYDESSISKVGCCMVLTQMTFTRLILNITFCSDDLYLSKVGLSYCSDPLPVTKLC